MMTYLHPAPSARLLMLGKVFGSQAFNSCDCLLVDWVNAISRPLFGGNAISVATIPRGVTSWNWTARSPGKGSLLESDTVTRVGLHISLSLVAFFSAFLELAEFLTSFSIFLQRILFFKINFSISVQLLNR